MRISFLASHGGSSARHIIDAIRHGELDAEIGVLITNNRDAAIFTWCVENAVPAVHISSRTHPDESVKDDHMARTLEEFGTDLVVLSGYMKKIGAKTLRCFSNRILNIHPSLLPKHGGKGFFGDRVHESVIASGDLVSGATVQYINEEYDKGPIICQRTISLEADDTTTDFDHSETDTATL